MSNISKLFNETPLYIEKEFVIFNEKNGQYFLDYEEYNNCIEYLGIKDEKMVSNCIECKKEFPFNVYRTYSTEKSNFESYDSILLGTYGKTVETNCYFPRELEHINAPFNFEKCDDISTLFVIYSFICANNSEHKYFMMVNIRYILKEHKIIITKIGQYPEITLCNINTSKEYRNELNYFESYDDYKNSIKSYNYNLSVGAFDYLRRVFEKMVDKYLHKLEIFDEKKDCKMSDKISAIKNEIEPSIRQYLTDLYKSLSAGVHTMNDEECKKYYEFLKTLIDIQLEYEKSNKKRKNMIKASSKALKEITLLNR